MKIITIKKLYALTVLGRLNKDTFYGKKYKKPTMIKADKYRKHKEIIMLLLIFIMFIEAIFILINY